MEFLFPGRLLRGPCHPGESSREAAAGSDWAGPTSGLTPVGLRPKRLRYAAAKPLGDREQVVVQVPAAIIQRHLLIGAMARSAKG